MIANDDSFFGRVLNIVRLLPGVLRDSRAKGGWEKTPPRHSAALWGGDPESLRVLAVARSAVFTFRAGERDLVLKLTRVKQRSVESAGAEAHFVEYLGANGLPVCRPVRSVNGTYVERIELAGRGAYTAFVVEKARGTAVEPGEVERWPPALVERWGAIVGRMHALAKSYVAPNPLPDLGIAERLTLARRKLGSRHPDVLASLTALGETFATLPRDVDSFGRVHGDMTSANLFRCGDELTIFDFESSFGSWYAADIASPVYAALAFGGGFRSEAGIDATARFFRAFMTGYVRENVLPRWLIAYLPDFVAFLVLFTVIMFYDQRAPARARLFMRTVDALVRREGALQQIGFGWIYDEVLAASLRSSARTASACCEALRFEPIEELGHAHASDWDLGRCVSCGSLVLRQWSEQQPGYAFYHRVTADESAALRNAGGPERGVMLKRWCAAR